MPIRRDAARNRERLLAAARAVFSRAGVLAPLDEVAMEAGVGRGTLYRHFPDRESLVDAVTSERLREFYDAAEGLPLEHRLEALIVALFRFLAEMPDLLSFIRASTSSQRRIEDLGARLQPLLAATLVLAHERDEVREDLDVDDLLLLIAMADGLVGVTAREPRIAENMRNRALELLLRAVARPA